VKSGCWCGNGNDGSWCIMMCLLEPGVKVVFGVVVMVMIWVASIGLGAVVL